MAVPSKLLLLIVCIFSVHFAFSQKNKDFKKENISDKETLKKAIEEIKTGDYHYKSGMRYATALNHYLAANKINPENAELNMKIGHCLIFAGDRIKAQEYFEKAFNLDKSLSEIHYYLGMIYHLNMKWDAAIKEYKQYSQKANNSEKNIIAEKINECKVGLKLMATPNKEIKIENLGEPINTEYPEYAPIISADESVLIFVSRRPNTTGGEKDPLIDDFFEDLYISYKNDGKWSIPEVIEDPINTIRHDGTVYLSPDGQKLYVYRDENGDGNIFESNLSGTKWLSPQKLSTTINSKYQEPSATFSPDGKTIYFVSDNPKNSLGGKDIFVSRLNDDGKWSEPENLGNNINTKYDEDGVFMHPDGKTLYFSSKGHKGMGGYDIYKSILKKGKWSKPENLGYPINSPDEDIFFSISANGKHGYYSSIMPNGKGSKDIYLITWTFDEVDTIPPKTPQLTLLRGIITDKKTNEFLEAKIIITNIQKNEKIAEFKSNSATGKYLFSLPAGYNYGISVNADGYLFHSENVIVPESNGYQEINKDIALLKIEVGNKVVLKNIFFDFAQATLIQESKSELERLTDLLRQNNTLKIEISGHTDNKGSAELNQNLSEKRAKAVYDYLTKNGIDQNRLTYRGYGQNKPIAPNQLPNGTDNPEGRQLNRRTEVEITEM